MENGSVPEATGYYNNFAVTCTSASGQSVTMRTRSQGVTVICEPVEPHRCEAATTYKASGWQQLACWQNQTLVHLVP